MKYISIVSAIFLLAVMFFGWGFATVEYKVFPWSVIKPVLEDLREYASGGESNKKTITEKLANDAGLRPARMLVGFSKTPGRDYRELDIPSLKKRRDTPLVYFDKEAELSEGYILVWGCFDFEDNLFGAILVDQQGRVVHRWVPDESDIRKEIEAYNNTLTKDRKKVDYTLSEVKFPHGLAILPNGSLIFNDGDPGNAMQKIDYHSNTQWVKLGGFHHAISQSENDSVLWSMSRESVLNKIDPESGKTLEILRLQDLIRANPGIDILTIRRDLIDGKWMPDKWHVNDVEPLPSEYETAYPKFKAGDLLLSLRSLNAVMVVDPVSEQIKWWRIGAYSRQHDPDWQPNGEITVYDNQMRDKYHVSQPINSQKFSRIVSVDPNTYEHTVLYDGERDQFYSKIRGKHQILPNGDILITSSMQGRIMLVDSKGKTVFELLNRYDDESSLLVSEAIWLPKDFFEFEVAEGPEKRNAYEAWVPGSDMSLHYAVDRLEIEELQDCPLATPLSFRDEAFIALDGWSKVENNFRWSEGSSASISFRLNSVNGKKKLTAQLRIHTLGKQGLRAYLNDKLISEISIDKPSAEWLSFPLPADATEGDSVNTLRLEFPDAHTPNSRDNRMLAVALYSFRLKQK